MEKRLAAVLVLSLHFMDASAWLTLCNPTARRQRARKQRRRWTLASADFDGQDSVAEFLDSSELEMILGHERLCSKIERHQSRTTRYQVVLPSRRGDQSSNILASLTTASKVSQETTQLSSAASSGSASNGLDSQTLTEMEMDPYASAFDSQMEKAQMYAERVEEANKRSTLSDRFKSMDLQDIISTLIIPSIALFAAGRWVFNRVSGRVIQRTDTLLRSFAQEMIFHDGDFDEMKLCFNDYSRKLLFLGTSRTVTMLKFFVETYVKKKTVSPQAITTLGYVFSLAKLSEEQTANVLVALCRRMGPEKISSSGKVLFLGTRILKSTEGRAALEPIKDMIKATYRDATYADSLVDTSQQAMAEASYRSAVQAAGKSQKTLTVGWETLGLDHETARRIFNEEAEDGFVSDRESMYGGQTQKYDKKGRRLNKDGTPSDPAEAKAAKEEANEEEAVSNVYECGECGYTLFVAEGRESKFFGPDFKCPECGASKDKFEARDSVGED